MYEGVGWTVQGVHTQGYNNVSLGLAFFGNKLGNGHPLSSSARESSTLFLCSLVSTLLPFQPASCCNHSLTMTPFLKFFSPLDSLMWHDFDPLSPL